MAPQTVPWRQHVCKRALTMERSARKPSWWSDLCTGPCQRVTSGALARDTESALVYVARCNTYCQSSVSSQACDFHLCFQCTESAGLSRKARGSTCDVVDTRRIRCAHCLIAFRPLSAGNMCLLLPPRHAARPSVCKEASDRQRACVARRWSEAGIMRRRTPLPDPHHKHVWGPLPAGRRASGACRGALPAKAAGNGTGGPRKLCGVHCWSFIKSNRGFVLCCSALLYCHAACAALPPAASAALCDELCKGRHYNVVHRHRGPAHMCQLVGTCHPTDMPAGTLQQRCSCTPNVDAHNVRQS